MPTEEKKVTRKLRAILSADVKGYSTNGKFLLPKTVMQTVRPLGTLPAARNGLRAISFGFIGNICMRV